MTRIPHVAMALAVGLLPALAACSTSDPSSLVVTASSGTGAAEVELTVDGETTTEQIDAPWRFETDVAGEFSVRVEVTDLDGGDDAACAIQLDAGPPIEATGGGTATCRLSGRAGGGSSDVTGRSETGAAPTTEPELPDEIVVSTVEVADGVFSFDISNAWEVLDLEDLSVYTESGFVEPRAFELDALDLVADATHPDGSVIVIDRHRRPLSVREPLAEVAETVRASVDPNGAGDEQAFGPTTFAGVESFEYVTKADDRTISWYLFRAGTDLFAVSASDRGNGDVASILESLRVDFDALDQVSHWTRISLVDVAGTDLAPSVLVPADAEVFDENWLESSTVGVRAQMFAETAPFPVDEIRERATAAGYSLSTLDVDGFEAIVADRSDGSKVERLIAVPIATDLLIQASFEVAPDQIEILEDMADSFSLE